ncbi:MAG TPA: substrate-binding domain-containing protein [Casimicrobiaceae bacterium]|nr:substrate-binding domain-containing protein [Casimicrobiaceae bacterium]
MKSDAERIAGISSMAMRLVLSELASEYRERFGIDVTVESVGGVDAARRVQDGEAFDFVVLAKDAIAQLAESGQLDPASLVDLARSGVAIAVRRGATRPDIATEAALRDAVLRARAIGYSTGPSGAHLVRVFERWNIADQIARRIVQAPPGIPVATLVARGDAELGFQQLSELMRAEGIDVVGPLPDAIQLVTVFTAAICTQSKRRNPTRELLAFLAVPAADAAKARYGMEHARAGT